MFMYLIPIESCFHIYIYAAINISDQVGAYLIKSVYKDSIQVGRNQSAIPQRLK